MSDYLTRQNIIDELEFDPRIDASRIGVTVENGVVTLTGNVSNYGQKLAAERAAARVVGVRGIAQEIQVQPAHSPANDDAEIARRALDMMRWSTMVPEGQVLVAVENGHLTLTGALQWDYQRAGAESAIEHIPGVTGVTNLIELKPRVSQIDLKANIDSAMRRRADLDHEAIRTIVTGNRVILEGHVNSWNGRTIAEQAARSTSGVTSVDNRIMVSARHPVEAARSK
ncbi:MAG: BON domain-containing protein [Devosia sp.]